MLAIGVWTDAIHALTALAFAAVVRDRAAAGITDAAIATTWAAAGYRDTRRATGAPVTRERWRDTLARRTLSRLPRSAGRPPPSPTRRPSLRGVAEREGSHG